LRKRQFWRHLFEKNRSPQSLDENDRSFEFAMSVLGTKWTFSILRQLISGKRRTSALLESLKGISPRTLAERLRHLETSGIITRQAYAEIPPRVEYSLTDVGRDVGPVLSEIIKLGDSWRAKL
jgi:DNA-binding HxlR family transcriptional regulator